MSEPLDIQALAKETADQYANQSHFGLCPNLQALILSALTKFAAEKDAEIARANKNEAYWRAEWKKAHDSLASHKAALTVATDALKWCAPKCDQCTKLAIYKQPWTDGDYLCADHSELGGDPELKDSVNHPASRALQQIDTRLKAD